MSEKIKHNKESARHRENHESNKELSKHAEKIKNDLEKESRHAKHEHKNNIEKIRSSIDDEAKNNKEHARNKQESEKSENDQPILVNKELKDVSYKRTLRKTQAKLSPASRSFSKIVHQPTVEKISEAAGKTVARPSGILFGGIFSFLGSSIFLWTARHYGYEYNFLLFMIFFVGGFFIGLILELLYRVVKK